MVNYLTFIENFVQRLTPVICRVFTDVVQYFIVFNITHCVTSVPCVRNFRVALIIWRGKIVCFEVTFEGVK